MTEVPEVEPFVNETLVADGWEYRDIPRLSPIWWDRVLAAIGPENYRVLAMSSGVTDKGSWARGQVFISPKGLKNLEEFGKTMVEAGAGVDD